MSDIDTPTLSARPRRKTYYRPIPELLTAVQVALDNTQADPTLQAALRAYGYTAERLDEGRQLYEEVMAHQRQQETGRGQKISATTALKSTWEQAYATYARLFKVARIALQAQPSDLVLLGLNGRRKQRFAERKEQALQFYTNALAQPQTLARLAEFGVTEARLREGLEQINAAAAAYAAQQRDKGSAQQATHTRNAALSNLRRWYSAFITIARVALAEQPQQLEKLGIVVPS